jgi:uncharacterized caspase-like protein
MKRPSAEVGATRLFLASVLLLLVFCATGACAQNSRDNSQRLTRHAIIIGVGKYSDPGIPTLHGVVHDINNAKRMAQGMGVADSNIVVLQDEVATYANIRKALRDLSARVRDGDRVFIYYSGHGTRITVPESTAACREALIPSNTQMSSKGPLLSQEDIAEDLAAVYAKADKVFVFFDACHSGGVRATGTRASNSGKANEELVAKFATLESAAQCSTPSNVRRRSTLDAAKIRGALPNNVVQVSSSRPDEISLDSASTGGLATDAWRYCSVYADDSDASGTLSVLEISNCVQRRINDRLKDQPRYTGQNIVVTGNTGFAPALPDAEARLDIERSGSPHSQTTPPLETALNPSASLPTRPNSQTIHESFKAPRFPLESILSQSDDRHRIDLQYSQNPLVIGRDYFDIRVQSDRGGYVYLVLQSSDNESTYVIFPNGLDQDNQIKPKQWLQLPRSSWRLKSQGPAGKNRLLVMVTDAPRTLSELKGKQDGPFVKTLNDRPSAQALAWLAGTSSSYSSLTCGKESAFTRKDLEYISQCSDSFGARIIEFLEVR